MIEGIAPASSIILSMNDSQSTVSHSASSGVCAASRLPAWRLVLIIARHSARRMLRQRQNVIFGFFYAAPALFFLFVSLMRDTLDPRALRETDLGIHSEVYLLWLTGLPALFYGTSALAREVEEKTITYLFVRPIPKWTIFAGKFLALYLVLALATTLSYGAYVAVAGFRGVPNKEYQVAVNFRQTQELAGRRPDPLDWQRQASDLQDAQGRLLPVPSRFSLEEYDYWQTWEEDDALDGKRDDVRRDIEKRRRDIKKLREQLAALDFATSRSAREPIRSGLASREGAVLQDGSTRDASPSQTGATLRRDIEKSRDDKAAGKLEKAIAGREAEIQDFEQRLDELAETQRQLRVELNRPITTTSSRTIWGATKYWAVLMAGLLAYSSLFAFLGVAFRRPMILGIIYAVIVTTLVALPFFGRMKYLAISFLMRKLVHEEALRVWDMDGLTFTSLGSREALAYLLGGALLLCLLSAWRITTREYVLSQE